MKARSEILKPTKNASPNTPYHKAKRWHISITRGGWPTQKARNYTIEASYHQIIDLVKTYHLKHGDIYFERNYKQDPTAGYLAMHCFITPSFYIYLECNPCYDYHAEYSFFNCQYQIEVMDLLKRHPLEKGAFPIELKPDFKTFYKRTLEVSESKFLYCFKG